MDALVCDNGTGFIKLGWASSNFPSLTIPNVVGRPNSRFEGLGELGEEEFIGDEALSYQHMLALSKPMESGSVADWEGMLKVWDYSFNRLSVDPPNTNLLLTEAPLNSRQNRGSMIEVLLDTFGFAGVKVEYQATLGLYARGLMTGTIFDSGEGVSHVIPIHEGRILEEAIQRINLAGWALTDYLFKLLNMQGYGFHSSYDFEQVRMIKEKLCYVSLHKSEDMRLAFETTAIDKEWQLPDGSWVRIGKERFLAMEPLFKPSLIGIDQPGVSDMIFKSILGCAIDLRKDLFQSVILSGGTTLHPGFVTRVERELNGKLKQWMDKNNSTARYKVKVEDPPDRRYLVFIGGAAYASILQGKPEVWITKEMWEEEGMRLV